MSIVTQHPSSLCHCGKPGAPVTLIAKKTGEELNGIVCDACWEGSQARLDQVRPVAAMMRICQVPDDIVDEVMTSLLERLDDADIPPR